MSKTHSKGRGTNLLPRIYRPARVVNLTHRRGRVYNDYKPKEQTAKVAGVSLKANRTVWEFFSLVNPRLFGGALSRHLRTRDTYTMTKEVR